MAAYGLYTHIASNKFRSMLLLAGLFVLFYVMVYAGALIAEVDDQQRQVGRLLSDGGARATWSRPFPMRRAPPRCGS